MAIRQHPLYPLVIAANRDEYHARPAAEMAFWPDQQHILAGRDLQAGGSWLGINKQGQFAAVTNYRLPGASRDDARSRGELVSLALGDTDKFEQHLARNQHQYNPFNLVFGDISLLRFWGYGSQGAIPAGNGFHSISNGPIDEIWPKMSRGVAELSTYISASADLSLDKLLPIMLDRTQAPEEHLPATGIGLQRERELSSIFIQGALYGTRTTTLLLYGRDQRLQVLEVQHAPERPAISCRQFSLSL